LRALQKHEAYFDVSAKQFMDGDSDVFKKLDNVYGQDLCLLLGSGLQKLSRLFHDLGQDNEARLIGPTLEGQ
jgi:hypothetical protein